MQFNPPSGTGVIQEITRHLGSSINLTNYSLDDRTAAVNARAHVLWFEIFDSYGGWVFMDANLADPSPDSALPFADQDIDSGSPYYFLPDGALTVRGAEILYQNATTWQPLRLLTYDEFLKMGGDARFPSPATPLYAVLQGNVIRLLSTPNYTQANSLRVFFDEAMTEFSTSDTTKSPGFVQPFHYLLGVGGALDYAESHATSTNAMAHKAVTLSRKWDAGVARLRSYYGKRYAARIQKRIGPGSDLMDEMT